MPADDVDDRRPEGLPVPSRQARSRFPSREPAGISPGSDLEKCVGRRGFRFRRADRLLERRDFDRVLRAGRRRSLPELVVVTCPPGLHGRIAGPGDRDGALRSRLGITVGRKAGSAVERNRFKRRVREWFRLQRDSWDEPRDMVVIARRPAVVLSLEELSDRLARLLGPMNSQMAGKPQEIR